MVSFVAALLLTPACSSTPTPTTPPTGGGQQGTPTAPPGTSVAITLADFSISPNPIVASTAQDLTITNNGSVLHNFSIEGTPIDRDVPPGQTITLTAPGPSFSPGSYTAFCKYRRSQGMEAPFTALAG